MGKLSLQPITPTLLHQKQALMRSRYEDTVAVMEGSEQAQALLLQALAGFGVEEHYQHGIANAGLCVVEDLCLLDVQDEQRLIAGCLCAPSYWCLGEKIGQPLRDIHAPVQGMNDKIGDRIAHFIAGMPVHRGFFRRNYFLHGDAERFHPETEVNLPEDPHNWFVRSEGQTLYKISSRYLLFALHVQCEPLRDIVGFAEARLTLSKNLRAFDAHEIAHFGGWDKYIKLLEYLVDER